MREYTDGLDQHLTVLDGVARENGTIEGIDEDPRVEEAFRNAGRLAARLEDAVMAAFGDDVSVLGTWSDHDDDGRRGRRLISPLRASGRPRA